MADYFGSKKPVNKPIIHSWSGLNAFETCAWRFYQTKVLKSVKEPQSESMMEGNEHHKALELAVRDGIPLPAKYEADLPIVQSIRNSPGIKLVEWQFGITRNWTETTFWAPDVWIRGKIDVGVIGTKHAFVGDYKTGKVKDDDGQLGMFALPTFIKYPYLETIKSAYLWLGNDKTSPVTFVREQVPELKEKFAHRIHRLEDANKRDAWHKNPSGLCRNHCPVPRALCEFQGRMI